MWQDYAIAVVVLVFTLTTIPMIRARLALPLWTTLPMVVGALILTIAYATLGLWFSVGVESLAVVGWAILFYRSLFKRGV